MADRYVQRRSQGTDMYDYLRFPDAIAFEEEVRNCNKLAIPLASRTVTNKCYTLLWKATYFPSSITTGIPNILHLLQSNIYVPCLVILAADTYIDDTLRHISTLCIKKDIPYIFIPNKMSMGEALNANFEMLAVFISYNRDPGMRREFEDAFEGMRILCSTRKRKRYNVIPLAGPPEIGPRGEMPQMVSTSVSTVPPGQQITTLLADEVPSSSSEWLTISEDDDSTESTRDISVSAPDADGNDFQEYIRVASPTPAPSPSQKMYLQNKEEGNESSSAATCSSEDSPRPGPSREFPMPLIFPLKRPMTTGLFARKRRILPFRFPNDGSGEGPSESLPASSTCGTEETFSDITSDDDEELIP
ncbi:hypothetical protein WA026_008869 [Henosepilachna vigintioctopunctata]|uniref:Ribosomal protein eL8/eL30/eS12/Gadd45 domain-containing protein n=1 Tax=Henosepilachna vigintioctopunctata TaxID=420089 RepID=A0AAW1VAL4_9CUCU